MRMVDSDITAHLVRVLPPEADRYTYVILDHGQEVGDCPLEQALIGRMAAVATGEYEVSGVRRADGEWALHWRRPNQPDLAGLARQNFTVTSVPFTFPIPLDKRRQVQSAAAEQGITPNDWVQQAIDEKLTKGLGE